MDRESLVENEELVNEIFSILAVAHYRTSPNDLQMMLEAPDHILLVAVLDGRVVGALEAAVEPREGGRGRGVIPDILERLGLGSVGRGYRVVRIAVVPCLQRRGIGSKLLERLEEVARSEGMDWVGASFGHHEPLGFWLRNGYIPIHVSPRFNLATGEKNIVVAKPVSGWAKTVIVKASCLLLRRLVYSGSSVYRDVAAETIAQLLAAIPCGCGRRDELDELDLARIRLFLEGVLAYETLHDVLLRLAFKANSECVLDKLGWEELLVYTLLVVQGKPVYEAEKLLGLTREEAEERLRRVVRAVLGESLEAG